MHPIDLSVIALYLLVTLGIGLYFARRSKGGEEYFVASRQVSTMHTALSVVATDVGGGFSIGLGGLAFTLGLSASWMLLSGLLAAWLSAVVLIPRVKPLGDRLGWLTYPDYLEYRYDRRVRLTAACMAALGHMGFVGAQLLAGAKLSSALFSIDLGTSLALIAGVAVLYTALGGMKAVVYTDVVQWLIILVGLCGLALPFALLRVGGLEGLRQSLPPGHLRLDQVSWPRFSLWMLTIVPSWLVANTFYQRIYAARDLQSAKRAWYIAGLFEYPVIAFTAAGLGLCARALFPDVEAETALPRLIHSVLPVGAMGLVLAAYFSAIMSTADSCLLAAVSLFVHDLYGGLSKRPLSPRATVVFSQIVGVVVGAVSVAFALILPRVLDIMLDAYAFMVSALVVPTLGGLLWPRARANAAFASMVVGGVAAGVLTYFRDIAPYGEAILLALPAALLTLIVGSLASKAEPFVAQESDSPQG